MNDSPRAAELYVPRFNAMDADDVRPFVEAVATAQLVTVGEDGVPDATFLPVLWEGVRLVGHLARANGHWRRIVDGSPALAVVTLATPSASRESFDGIGMYRGEACMVASGAWRMQRFESL